MPIQVACPSCSQPLRVPDNLIGEMVKCPKCESAFTATAESNAPSERGEPATSESQSPSTYQGTEQPRVPETLARPPRPESDDDFRDEPRRARKDYAPHRGTLILVLTGLTIFTGIPAWVMGNGDLRQIRAGVMDPEGEANTNIGRILGMISTILFIVALVPFCSCCLLGPFGRMR
jgi:hypothetical protein